VHERCPHERRRRQHRVGGVVEVEEWAPTRAHARCSSNNVRVGVSSERVGAGGDISARNPIGDRNTERRPGSPTPGVPPNRGRTLDRSDWRCSA
jgi:hypothetical protein